MACWQAVMAPTHLERFLAQSYKLSETTFYHYELRDPWVQGCLEDWAAMLDYVGEYLDPVLFDSLLLLVATHTVNFTRLGLARKEFNSFGALQFDKDVRALRSFFTSRAHEVSLRDAFAPLNLTSTLLLSDSPRDALEEAHNLALTAKEKINVLLLRVDFNKQDVLALHL
ncbi:unnamed protein product [Phytomonas sp. Hart1]|nr:unnamed protein product [Phytomonas sp. Hart1]|eukprot:CCW69072.1 unnamed protein product [Phytomonas sp. isolate Hart1]